MAPRNPRSRVGRDERGYIAVTTGLILVVLMCFSAFAVDVGNWYLTGQRAQRAADAAALAGVVRLPGNRTAAYAMAADYAANNGFTDGAASTTVSESLSGGPTRLRVDVTRTVDNIFGPLLGLPRTTISRHAVADYAGPVPLGSPCNRFGDDPDPKRRSTSSNCDSTGQFWANIGSPAATKVSGDAFQDNDCDAAPDGCVGSINNDYDARGYIYTVTLKKPVSDLKIDLFDPAMIVVGDYCDLGEAKLADAAALPASNTLNNANPLERYAPNAGPYCTGDQPLGSTGTGLVRTQFKVFAPGTNQWDPLTWPVEPNCTETYLPFRGDLSKALDTTSPGYVADVAKNFRRWVNLCRVAGNVAAGTYAIQVKTNDLGVNLEGGHNRFAIRAYGSGASDKDNISIAGFGKMGMYGNTPVGTSKFYLARVPSSANGQVFNIRLFDIGDGAKTGSTITVLPPSEIGGTFSGCVGQGVVNQALSGCQISVNSSFNGKWQTISVPIPSTYACEDASLTGCWVRLEFYYGPNSTPADTTSWTASVEGDPIRLVE